MRKILFFTLIYLFSTVIFANEKLIFAVDLIRHGDRNPGKEIPASPYPWEGGLGELTAKGMNQEYQLGVALRKKYIDQYHLLPIHYQAETLYVRSTDMDRTLMSAASLLYGLYPLGSGPLLALTKQFALPSGFQPIPIHTVPVKEDKLLLIQSSRNIFSILKIAYLSRHTWKEKMAGLQDKLQTWSAATGMKFDNFLQFNSLADNLHVRTLQHVPLPPGINQSDAQEIMSLGEWSFVKAFKLPEITHPMGHRLLVEIANRMQDVIDHKSKLKYILFSGHDVSIMAVMNTLGAPLNASPPYASDLNFSLWEKDNSYFIHITYNNQPVSIPGCDKNVCSIEQFKRIAKR